ncbi:MAG: orotate phosphoribosyltransferase [Thermoplasmata archaeon]
MMKSVGLCHICGKPAMLTCPLCGRVVCRSCFDAVHGTCPDCKERKTDEFERRF